ncbi:hypothetical protein HR059_08445 [Sinorhizobium meliloti WSM1022]|jgi:hypothetical protein|uniref:hypothetical protein n=1 Tax=Rhizobium meliloti TaxID=382 RepID=UPI000FD459DC|nr:hypothetical protein [Sinorhizobium meliloti]MCO6423489.1 hypothetical protein [Sinorhizobium meliloti]MDW9409364.1 hypothetical protein [Sinorhizobium meliloti]MDW9442087.1 hypothetical protein [Sinorhizobium meliloti]MDW9454520.1 hypothetical protein [Sinorhizobium meliloti]MDW9468380.1 hypothetical protein [Sinorhizobium meliloti]
MQKIKARLIRRAALYVSKDCNLSSSSSLCLSQGSSSAASAAREEFFQPKDLVWLDPCDKHRDEEINKPRRVSRNSTGLGAG